MNWQLTLVFLCIALAAAYLTRQTWRTWTARKSGSCGGGCGCAKTATKTETNNLIGTDELTARLRNRR